MVVRFLTIVLEGRNLPEFLPKLMLSHVKVGRFLTNVGHFIGLEWRNLLFDCDRDLLGVIPLFW